MALLGRVKELGMDVPELQNDPMLAEIVRRLVEAYHPERIYLFGSHARGEAGPDSDYDLMVVVSEKAPPRCGGAIGAIEYWRD
jgi:predicted nucleotidyltransferase